MYTIVIADDEAKLREALARRIDWADCGFELVGEAENGVEALELVEKLEPDLLLSDVKMPFMSGIELARAVREIRPAMNIAFLSGFDDFAYAQQAIQYNIISYILKPVSAREMTEELKKIRAEMNRRFEFFTRQTDAREMQSLDHFLLPLILDEFQEGGGEREKELRAEAVRCGLLNNAVDQLACTVMVTSFFDEDGVNRTTEDSLHTVHNIAEKFMHHAGFLSGGRVISLLLSTQKGMDKYLHIIVDDLSQSVKRVLSQTVAIGVSCTKPGLTSCHEAYAEAVRALGQTNGAGVQYLSDIRRVESLMAEHRISSGSDLCDRALEVIWKKFADPDLSLIAVSSEIAVSPNYLSALIKRCTGSNFVELLTRQRIETAKELLRTSSLKIREITERCGYSDQHYFSYCFKKYEGISPNVYRRQHEEGENGD
ncbi:MAG: response regulator [Lachnospiraceae bacterium]|nr:response regulator [Lachnospiraceae bacterium]